MKNLIIYAFCLGTAYLALGQEEKETITRDLSFRGGGSNQVLQIDNINGNVRVEAYEGTTVQLEVEKTLKASSPEELARARQEIKLGIDQAGDSILVYIEGPSIYRRGPTGWRRYSEQGNGNGWNNRDRNYHYDFNFKIKVPARTNLIVSTVNAGDVRVDNVQGVVHASNINGGVYLTGVGGQTKASTINGPVQVVHRQNPTQSCSYRTHNGKIEVSYPPGLSADLRFKAKNGEAYTDFDVAEQLAATVEKTSNSSKGNSYRYESASGVRIGKGGLQHTFETYNGDIMVRKIK